MSDNILREVNPEWFTKVVDDILVFGKNKNEAYERFEKILKIFEKHGLIVSCEKLQEGNIYKKQKKTNWKLLYYST